MPTLLLIDTSTSICSVAVSINNHIVTRYEINNNNHAEHLTIGIQECIDSGKIILNDIDAIALNGGPGSYTGLRIGLSVAKGLCYSLGKPLIMIDALELLATGTRRVAQSNMYCILIDNKRNEVFYALYNDKGNCVSTTQLASVEDTTLTTLIHENLNKPAHQIIYSGSGARKLKSIFPGIHITDTHIIAEDILNCALTKFHSKDFSDVAYSEPFYHKAVYIAPRKM
jgi:tRNA threonylcarbamoyladenosine biosynthesis protein TsaB